jgi:hypothetical protein
MKHKKAQGMPLRIIIIAILLLIVLFVVIYLLLGGVGKFSEGLRDCKAKGGTGCVNATVGCKSGEIGVTGICDKGELCCLPT